MFVLLQSDTQPQQPLAQTLLSVVKLDARNGAIQEVKRIELPDVATAYSAWVDKGDSHFKWQGDTLVIAGNYFLMSDKNRRPPFDVRLDRNLNP